MTRVIDLDGPGRDWREVVMPASSGPVELVRLHAAGAASVSLVRFPAGWSRPATGRYPCAEEFIVLDGLITVSGVDFPTGTYAYLPPSTPRTASLAGPGGCLAVAWFSGAPAWQDGLPDAVAPRPFHAPIIEALRMENGVTQAQSFASASDIPGSGILESGVAESATVPGVQGSAQTSGVSGSARSSGFPGFAGDVEVLSPSARTWTYGTTVPDLPGPLFIRYWPTS